MPNVLDESQPSLNIVSPIGPDQLPPPYQSSSQSGMPMVTCRVCQAMIDISNKKDQHVVKCTQCNEATVTFDFYSKVNLFIQLLMWFYST